MIKTVLRTLLATIAFLATGAITYSYIAFNTFAPSDEAYAEDENLQAYYAKNYDEARARFLSNAKHLESAFEAIEVQTIKVPSKVDTALYTDVCYIPPKTNTGKLLIMTSGLHGIEGYTGSALQDLFMQELSTMQGIDDMGFLFIHALNPYGFKYGRKVTENNVDLNRNCMLTPEQFDAENDGFVKMYDMLTPSGSVNVNSVWNRSFHLIAINKIVKETMPVLRQAALQGQYDYPEGIYYGSQAYEPQIADIMPVIHQYINDYPLVLNVDLHTGYGARGELHLFIDRPEDKAVEQGIERIFSGQKIDWSEGDDFYSINGEYVGLVAAQADSALVIPMLVEFGTMDSQTTFGSLKSIHTMICENQGANNGYKNETSELKAKNDMMELYCPTSGAWRAETIRKGQHCFDGMMDNFKAY